MVVPARNEQDSIAACIGSLHAAADASPCRERCWIVVVADACADQTAAVARAAIRGRGEVIHCAAGSAGTARRLGVDAVFRHFQGLCRRQLWLANTDADSEVPRDWISRQLSYAANGFVAVAGMITVRCIGHQGRDLTAALLADYTANADGTHTHVHGANLGLRADAYLDAGGWDDAALAEDHSLWRRVRERGWPVRSSASNPVVTSGRLVGRASGGFADTLRAKLERLCV
jgi:cellulose synthase/poly-beta-1,6-N-acetylglucosamine synthase-like glycosyltransferase